MTWELVGNTDSWVLPSDLSNPNLCFNKIASYVSKLKAEKPLGHSWETLHIFLKNDYFETYFEIKNIFENLKEYFMSQLIINICHVHE